MSSSKVEKLTINYKTLDDFKLFKASEEENLKMCRDLEGEIIDNHIESNFYGIYYGGTLVARMSLFPRKFNGVSFLELTKLEILPPFKGRGFGLKLINFAKTFDLPIVTYGKLNSNDFWLKMGFIETEDYQTYNFGKHSVFIWEKE